MLNYTFVGDDVDKVPEVASHANFVRQTKDGYVCTMPVQVDEWLGIFKTLELPNLMEDPEYLLEDGFNMPKLHDTLNAAFLNFTSEELLQRLEENQVPFARINARSEVPDDPQVQALESLWEFEHPFGGPMRQARPPARFSETPAEIFRCSPELGEHSREVLEEAGLNADEITDLRQRGIVK